MATNYTTKTASLRATKANVSTADIRKVQVSKEITIGGSEGTKVSSDEVKTKKLDAEQVFVQHQGKSQNVVELISEVASSIKTGIDVGTKTTEADNDSGDAIKPYGGISKINFKGDFVTVVSKGENELDLWIQKSTMYPELDQVLVGAPTSTGSAKLFTCTDANQTHSIPVTSGNTYSQITVNKLSSDSWGNNIMSLKAKTGHTTFSTDKTKALFVRTDYNGTTGSVIKVPFNVAAGTFDISKKYEDGVTAVATSPFSGTKGSVTDNKGTKVDYYCAPFGDDEAEHGRIPGQAEVEITITQTLSTILTLGGGTVVFNWAIDSVDNEAPSVAWTSVNMFYTQHKKPTVTFDSVSYNTKTDSDEVSGLIYNTAGSTATVTISALKDSQWKSSNTTDKRLTVKAAGSTTDNVFNASSLTKTGDDSAAVYSGSVDVKLGSSGSGTASFTVTPHGMIDGSESGAKTLGQFWGSIPTSTTKVENFGKETYRMTTPSTTTYAIGQKVNNVDVSLQPTTAYASATSVLDGSVASGIPVTDYNDCVQAVCQYGKLMHPNAADTDAKGTTYTDTTKPAIFIRKFQYTSDQTLTFTGIGIEKASAIYWFDGVTWNKISQSTSDGTYTMTTDKIVVKWNVNLHAQINSTNIPVIAILFDSTNANKLSPITLG